MASSFVGPRRRQIPMVCPAMGDVICDGTPRQSHGVIALPEMSDTRNEVKVTVSSPDVSRAAGGRDRQADVADQASAFDSPRQADEGRYSVSDIGLPRTAGSWIPVIPRPASKCSIFDARSRSGPSPSLAMQPP